MRMFLIAALSLGLCVSCANGKVDMAMNSDASSTVSREAHAAVFVTRPAELPQQERERYASLHREFESRAESLLAGDVGRKEVLSTGVIVAIIIGLIVLIAAAAAAEPDSGA